MNLGIGGSISPAGVPAVRGWWALSGGGIGCSVEGSLDQRGSRASQASRVEVLAKGLVAQEEVPPPHCQLFLAPEVINMSP